MADALAIEPLVLGAQVASGAGAAVDIGALRTAIDLVVRIDAVSGTTPELTVSVETSVSASGPWRTVETLAPIEIAAIGSYKLLAGGCLQFVRVAWVIAGTTPSFTLAVAGQAHVVYCDREDLAKYAMSSNVLDDIGSQAQLTSIIAATAKAASYLSVAYTLPLASWGPDLSEHTAALAVHIAAKAFREGLDEQVVDARDEAVAWLKLIGTGRLRPTTIIDATSTVDESGAYITSTTPRGW